jgi:hypothetical protein
VKTQQVRAHQTSLRAYRGVSDLAFELGFCHERGDRIDHNDIESVGADERLANAQRLLPRARLGDEKIVQVHSEFARVLGVERMFDINERRQAAALLRLRNHCQSERRLPGRLWAENFNNSSTWKSAHAKRTID